MSEEHKGDCGHAECRALRGLAKYAAIAISEDPNCKSIILALMENLGWEAGQTWDSMLMAMLAASANAQAEEFVRSQTKGLDEEIAELIDDEGSRS